jgi:DNA-directed RNA polymerase subunit N (RpoN/RPB10)
MTIRIRCVGCGHLIQLDEAYQSYEGQLRCWTCGRLMEVTIREGRLNAMSDGREAPNREV